LRDIDPDPDPDAAVLGRAVQLYNRSVCRSAPAMPSTGTGRPPSPRTPAARAGRRTTRRGPLCP